MTTYKVTFLIVAAVAIFSIPTIESQSVPKKPLSLTPHRYPAPTKKTPVPHPARFNYFDQELLKAAAEQITGNFMISPASIKSTLAMLLEAAEGSSADELRKALRLSDDPTKARDLFKTFLTSLNSKSDGINLQSANRIFLNNNLSPNPDYQAILQNYYKSDIISIDFNDQQRAVNEINQWIASATSNKITEFVDSGDFNSATIMILANALFFKGTWEQAFDASATRERCFNTTTGGRRAVQMMEIQADFNFGYIEALNSHAIEIPYKGNKYSMLILLPNEQGDVSSVVKDLSHVNFQDILDQMMESEVQLSLPKFKIDFESELIQILKNVGISKVFAPNANLSKIVTGGIQNPQVNSVIHKTHIEVNERGAVAAAVTGAVVIPLMGTTLETMNINHPFLFFIRDKTSGAILFGGRVNEPTLAKPSQKSQVSCGQAVVRRPQWIATHSGDSGVQNAAPQNIDNSQSRPNEALPYSSNNQGNGYSNPQNNSPLSSPQPGAGRVMNLNSERNINGPLSLQSVDKNNKNQLIYQTAPQSYPQYSGLNSADSNRVAEAKTLCSSQWRLLYQEYCGLWDIYFMSDPYRSPSGRKRRHVSDLAIRQHQAQPLVKRNIDQSLDCTTTHCELKNQPLNEAELRQYREEELKQHQEKLISEENLRQHLESELKLKQEQELKQQQQQLLSEQIYRQHQEEELRQSEINAENLRKSQEQEIRQQEAHVLNQEEREKQELKKKQEHEDLIIKQQDEIQRQQEAQAEIIRQNQEYEFRQKVEADKLLNQQRSQELKQLRAQTLEEQNFRQQLEQELTQKQELERNLRQRQEEEFRLKQQQEQLILEQHLRLRNETEQREQLIQEENVRKQQEQDFKQKQELELKNQQEKLQHEQTLRELQEAEQRQIEAQTELLRQIQEIELRQKEAQELKLKNIKQNQEQVLLSDHEVIVQNPGHLSGHNHRQYTAFNPGQSSANNPVQYSNQNPEQFTDFGTKQSQQVQQQHNFGRRG